MITLPESISSPLKRGCIPKRKVDKLVSQQTLFRVCCCWYHEVYILVSQHSLIFGSW